MAKTIYNTELIANEKELRLQFVDGNIKFQIGKVAFKDNKRSIRRSTEVILTLKEFEKLLERFRFYSEKGITHLEYPNNLYYYDNLRITTYNDNLIGFSDFARTIKLPLLIIRDLLIQTQHFVKYLSF